MQGHTEPPQPQAHNRLVARLATAERRNLLARCETVPLHRADVLSEPGVPMHHVDFPLGGCISLPARVPGHRGVEVGMVGNGGMLGAQIALGMATAPLHALVQGEGACLRMGSSVLPALSSARTAPRAVAAHGPGPGPCGQLSGDPGPAGFTVLNRAGLEAQACGCYAAGRRCA
ncbi:MAG TPA: hypothetical protein VMS38_27005 [Pseudorhodoferax sp.]|nr:hypothetical protein [Pseudorhodoferax sp.]